MAEFTCRLGTPTGEVVTRTYEAEAINELRIRLEREGYRIFTINKQGSAASSFGLSTQKSLSIENFLVFNQQLATMLRSGLPILQALGILVRRQESKAFRAILEDVESRVRSGTALSEAFAAQGSTFPRLYTASILAGERSGNMDEVLLRYVSYTKTITELRRKLKKTLTYPLVLIIAATGLIILMTTYVIPKFATVYESQSNELPYVTQLVVAFSNAVSERIVWIAPSLLVIIVGAFFWRRSENGRDTIDRWLLKLPVVGDLIRQQTTAQLTRSLATLLAGGITLLESFEIASESVTNRVLRKTMQQVALDLRSGQAFTESLHKADWLPPLALDMIGVGERSGSLREMLDEVANFFDAEIDVRFSTLTTIIEPIILVIMGIVVTIVFLAMYLPILKLMSNSSGAS